MKFGRHIPSDTRDRGLSSPMATFARGLHVGGTQWRFEFPNGYGASVINDGYGAEQGLYEVGVLFQGNLTYETPITDDVLGCLDEAEVVAVLDQVEALTPADIHAETVRRASAEVDAAQARLDALTAKAVSA